MKASDYNYIDLTYLKEIAEDNNALMKELVEIFISQIPEFVETMTSTLQNQDWDALSAIAHKAKSSLNVVGMHDLANELRTIEISAKERKDFQSFPSIIDKFQKETIVAIRELEHFVSTLP